METRTFEQLLMDLRNEKNWNYFDVAQNLNKLGMAINEKQIRKWELGLVYPDLDTIYKLSELYFISSEDFITAKNNSYAKDYHSLHMTLIKWFCYLTGLTLKIGYAFFILVIVIAVIGALIYFISQANFYVEMDKTLPPLPYS